MLAISLYKNDISKLLIEKGANVSYESESSGNIPLHTAVIYSNEDMIKYLLTYMNEHKLNTNIENNEGKHLLRFM
jgi:ankyrin repeat protein